MSSQRFSRVAAACFIAGLGLVLIVEASIARVVGVPLIFAGIALGVAAIATPAFLERDRGQPGASPPPRGSSRTG